MMKAINPKKWLFMRIGAQKVYKIFEYNGIYYKIIRIEPQMTWQERQAGKWCPKFILFQIIEAEYLNILFLMEKAGYTPYMNRYNERVIRYLLRHIIPNIPKSDVGFDIYELIATAYRDKPFLECLNMEGQ